MAKKKEGGEMAVKWTRASNLQIILPLASGSVAKGLAKDLEVADSGPVHCHFFPPLSFSLCVVLDVVFRIVKPV